MCQACADVGECGVCGRDADECMCRECVTCGVVVLEAEWDADSEQCPDCHAASHADCNGCREEFERDDLTASGLCETCEMERVDALRDAVTEAIEDDGRCEAIHAALKAAGLL